MRRTTGRLADGRAITYYDGEGAAPRDCRDLRNLNGASPRSLMRWGPLSNEWVIYAGHRQTRTFLPPSAECPLCPSSAQRRTEIPAEDHEVVVFENRFPSLSGGQDVDDSPPAETLFRSAPAHGRCEVVCFTPEHGSSFAELSPRRVRLVLDALADRTAELSAVPGVEQVFCFENRGEEIGVTLEHPHGQIYAYPYVTPTTALHLEAARAYAHRTSRNLFADLLEGELSDGRRVVGGNDHWTAFVPFAARWPLEVHVYPHRHVPDLPALTDEERDAFAPVALDVLGRMNRLYDAPVPYIAAWHQAPVSTMREQAYLRWEVSSPQRAPGKLKYLAGSESAMGAFINDVLPEDVAEALRRADA
jgi:UDPglucose--hexose-1-phosphate uridylyltransferase